jgi:hypothetical protein
MPSPLAALFNDLDTVFKQVSSKWYVFGAQAAIIHGAARLTADVDATVMYGDRDPEDLLQALETSGFSVQVDDAVTFLERTRVLPVVHVPSGMPVDIVFGGPGLEEEFLQRVCQYDVEGVKVPVACAEDLIAMKILSGRAKDVDDVSAIIAARIEDLDVSQIRILLGRLEAALDRNDLIPLLDDLLRRAR